MAMAMTSMQDSIESTKVKLIQIWHKYAFSSISMTKHKLLHAAHFHEHTMSQATTLRFDTVSTDHP